MNPTLGAHMTTYQYLIIGGGMAADSAAHGIREIDKDGSIAILSADVDSPYPRPALSKKLWTDPEFTWGKTDLSTAADTGAELAAALVQQGCEVSLVTPDPVLGSSQFPAQIASEYQKLFADAGVHLVTGHRVSSVRKYENAEVTLDDGIILEADDVVAGLGATPVTNLAEDAGLTVDNGVVVDEYLRTDDPAIWAAGDIANYPDPVLGRTRVEHVDNATMMGKAAGRSMAGSDAPYTHTPMMYSQVFGVRWEAVGALDSSLETTAVEVGDGQVVYYLKDGKPVGVLLRNLPGRTDEAVKVLADPPEDLSDAIN
ncbi:NAD(P)/FAD-dependent oxidoreductase [Cutibacterium avidum]|uniref:FAD-dependent oxidoreductase n=1 Tax=Cutibacterium avidum TaxID=33010 RepID=A0AB35XH48_9ACTN|nr:FAD-dependent oxidoreductase [Cutibacterium avidum]MBS6330321.1 FAD-dependent oxidoreductase [Propionibacterium sp.]MCO6673266.1 FAD-dependent oxidoreductase [Cutibacterium avidum]MCO6675035.1 FAD-dependent oxidoreductase [Cutibacterium avidum]